MILSNVNGGTFSLLLWTAVVACLVTMSSGLGGQSSDLAVTHKARSVSPGEAVLVSVTTSEAVSYTHLTLPTKA